MDSVCPLGVHRASLYFLGSLFTYPANGCRNLLLLTWETVVCFWQMYPLEMLYVE